MAVLPMPTPATSIPLPSSFGHASMLSSLRRGQARVLPLKVDALKAFDWRTCEGGCRDVKVAPCEKGLVFRFDANGNRTLSREPVEESGRAEVEEMVGALLPAWETLPVRR